MSKINLIRQQTEDTNINGSAHEISMLVEYAYNPHINAHDVSDKDIGLNINLRSKTSIL